MKVAELIDALSQYASNGDVVISSKPYGTLFEFQIKEREGEAIEEGNPLIVLEVTKEMEEIIVTVLDAG
jgi:biotin carboxyl carrier protein